MKIALPCILIKLLIIYTFIGVSEAQTEPTTTEPTTTPTPSFDKKGLDFVTQLGVLIAFQMLTKTALICSIAYFCHMRAVHKLMMKQKASLPKKKHQNKHGTKKQRKAATSTLPVVKRRANLMRNVEKDSTYEMAKMDMTTKQIKFIERKQKSVQQWDKSSKFTNKDPIPLLTFAVVANDLMDYPEDKKNYEIKKVTFNETSFVRLPIGWDCDDVDFAKSRMGGSIGSSSIMTASIRQGH